MTAQVELANEYNKSFLEFWGINGATSVCASVITVAVSMSFGIAQSFWTGFAFYLTAFIFFLIEIRR